MHTTHSVLIIEDEADLREALSTALSYEGFTTFTATDGEAGLEKALVEKPSLILLDIMMPKMDGLTVLKKLRKDSWGATVPVIVMTALEELDTVAEVVEGDGDYIVKANITLGGIVEKVKQRLGA
jgi:DNA-binding response OmpR family regulator